jgi:hypothetical protein
MNGGIRAAYQWYKNGKEISGENLNLFSTSDLKNSDTISCKIKNSIDSVISSIIIRNVYQYPNAPMATSISYCVGANAVALNANKTSGNSLVWYGTSATGGVSSTTAPIPSTSTAGTYIYYVSQKHSISSCESPRTALVVTVNQNPIKPNITRDVNNNLVSSATLGNQWYTDTTAVITGQTVQTYKPTITGYYAVKVTSNNCGSPFSDRYYYLVTALANFTYGQFIHLYPNPTSDDLIVDFNLTGQSQVSMKIIDANGKLVISKNKISQGSKLNVSQLSRGIYFVQVIDNNNQLLFTDKLIKE